MNASYDTVSDYDPPEQWQESNNPAYGEMYEGDYSWVDEWIDQADDYEQYEDADCFAESAEEYQRGDFD